ncbi:MAG: TonB-dependent receptor [Gemmatimonadaceae bacterium]|nr:TonB-dependent receptor [Gemmatimonadaceae bacterium]
MASNEAGQVGVGLVATALHVALAAVAVDAQERTARAPLSASAPRTADTGVITGIVRSAVGRATGSSDGLPLRGATVLAIDAPREPVSSNASGRFVIGDLRAGGRRLLVTAMGYAPQRLAVTVRPGETTHVEIALHRTAIELAGVTVSATAAGRDPLAVAQPVTSLGGRDLERSLGATLTQTLSWTSGVTARSQGPAATMPVIRGLTGERIVVLQDGQRAGDLAASASDHGVTVDPLAAREVEIVRGPAALLHGSAALGGVVNVLSDDIARTVPGTRLSSLTFNGQSASEGGGALLDVSQPLGATLVLRVKGGGRRHGDQGVGSGDARGALANTSMRNRNASIALTRLGERSLAGLALRGYDFEYGLPWRNVAADGVRLRGARQEASARFEREGRAPFARLRLDAGRQSYAHDEVTAAGVVATALGVRSTQAQLLARTRPAGWLRDGALGASFLHRGNDVAGPAALTPPNANRTFALFAYQDVAPFGDGEGARFPVAVRFERATVRSDASEAFGPAVERRFSNVSASAGVSVPVARGASLAVNVARATRVPSPEELYSRAGHAGTGAFETGNPALESERSRGVDLVVRIERPALRVQLAGWASAIDGWIGLYPTGRDTTIAAAGGGTKSLPLHVIAQRNARLRGAEATVEGALTPSLVVHASGDLLWAGERRGGALPFMPPARLGGGARWDDGRWQVGGAIRRLFAQPRVASGEMAVRGATLLEGHAGVRVIGGANVHTVLLRGENLGDLLYRDATSRIKDFAPAAGRNVSLLYRVTF